MKNLEIKNELRNLNKLIREQTINDEILDFQSACKILRCSPSYLYKLTSERKIPFFKPTGKKIYFSLIALHNWIKKKPCKTTNEIENESLSHIHKRKDNSL